MISAILQDRDFFYTIFVIALALAFIVMYSVLAVCCIKSRKTVSSTFAIFGILCAFYSVEIFALALAIVFPIAILAFEEELK